jgi:epoxyqueuosine reductase QueG
MNALKVVVKSLESTGLNLVGGAPIAAYDERAPQALASRELFAAAKSVVVIASGGPWLWRVFRSQATPATWREEHPLDGYVAAALDCVDSALRAVGVRFRRFEARVGAKPALDFRALGEIAGLGTMGPFGMLIHPEHGAWWALRGAYLIDAEVGARIVHKPPCEGCAAPCVAGRAPTDSILAATPEVRSRCVVGPSSRYDAEQIAYHYDRDATLARLRGESERR